MNLKYGPYSPSRLDVGICGHAFYKRYVDPEKKTKEPGNLPQARGSAVHEVFEKITERLAREPGKPFSDTEVKSWVVDAIGRNPAAYEETGQIMEMAKGYIQYPPKNLVSDASIELKLAVKMEGDNKFVECDYDDPQALGRGKADIMMISDDTTEAVVYDHKTQPNIEEADTFQMGFYAWVISKTYPFLNKIKTVLHFARFSYYSDPYVWDVESLAKIEDEILTRISIIENRQSWEAIPNKNCQYCPFIASCPALQEYMDIDDSGNIRVRFDNLKILGDTGKAVRLAGLVNILDQVSDVATKNLKEHVKAYGPIAIPGKIFEYRASEPKVNWDRVNRSLRAEIYAIFEKHGVDPKLFMGFSQTFSKGVWLTENERLVKDLAAILPMSVDTTFRGYKA